MSDKLTVQQVAEELQTTEDSVLGWIHSSKLKASDISNGSIRPRWRIRREDLDEFLDARRPTPPAKRKRKTATTGVIEFFK